MGNFEIFGLTISWWIYVPVIYSLWVFILFIVRRFIFGYIRKFTVRTQTKLHLMMQIRCRYEKVNFGNSCARVIFAHHICLFVP